jgi:hypothetical protein
MSRQNPIQQPVSAVQPVEASSLFQVKTAMEDKRTRLKRTRNWEKQNRAIGYLIPKELHLKAKGISESLLPIAAERMTTVSSVATAFMQYALLHVHANKLTLRGMPNAERRTMTLHWKEIEKGWPREIKPLKKHRQESVLTKPKPMHLAHRWGADIDREIRALSKNSGTARGEVVVFLLGYALDAYKSGNLILESEAIEVANRVTASSAGDE